MYLKGCSERSLYNHFMFFFLPRLHFLHFQSFEDADEEEMAEEVAQMREHVINHVDKDKDGVIQLKEFIEYANGSEFDHEDPWDAAFNAEFTDQDVRNICFFLF